MMSLMLDEFIRTIDARSLPRVLQIQSGVYFQGSVYEMFGRECCLPTGEVLKIIGINISMLTAEIKQEGSMVQTVNLPLDYPGLFRIVPDERPYLSIREIVESLRICSNRLGQPMFHCSRDMVHLNKALREAKRFTVVSLLPENKEGCVECEVTQRDARQRFTLALSQQGEFYECEDDQFYTLKELAEWKMPKGRRRTVRLAKSLPRRDVLFCDLPENYSGELLLSPVYELQAVMKYRKDVVRIPSNLDVEVIDITAQFDSDCFLQPHSLSDIFKKTSEEFPVVAEIIEPPLSTQEDFKFLTNVKQIVIHGARMSKRVLASEIRSDGQRRFLIPVSYNGRFKRRPREFPTAYDLEVAKRDKEELHVVATRAFESCYEGLCTVFVGDQYLVRGRETSEVIYGGTRKLVEALACEKIEGKKYESVLIPMCLNGGFVEVIHDKKQYSISEVCQRFHMPFNVKVSVRDLSMREDILAAVPGLCLEEEIMEPYLLISDMDLTECWEVPVNRIYMTLHLLQQRLNGEPQTLVRSIVEEIGEDYYYTLRRYAKSTVLPPPRPPKTPKPPLSDSAELQPPETASLLGLAKKSQPTPRHEKKLTSGFSDAPDPGQHKGLNEVNCWEDESSEDKHDYEYIDENELDSIRTKLQGQNINSSVKGQPSNAYQQAM